MGPEVASVEESPLRLVRVGWITLSESLSVVAVDQSAQVLLGIESEDAFEGMPLAAVIQPESLPDVKAVISPPPTTYLGINPLTSTRLLVNISRLPRQPALVATVTSVNEYLAESQALAHVQLRNTVESIIAGFAHEVRNPLAAILSLTEAAIQQHPSHDSVLVRIPGLVARVESLIKHSLAYSRPKQPKRSLHQASFLVDRATSLLRPRDTPVKLDLPDLEQEAAPVMVDLLHAEQVLVNLLENALDVARTMVRVTVSDGKTPVPSVCIEVSDDGPGVSAEVASRLVDPFFTTKAHGTGLGLAIARDLTRLNGGDLCLKSDRPGATFQVLLPSTHAPLRGHW